MAVDSIDEIAGVIEGWRRRWRATQALPYEGDDEAIARYGQPAQAAALAALLDGAVQGTVKR
jgi:hypothetical protein